MSRSKSSLFLAVVAGALGLLIGLVGTVERETPGPRVHVSRPTWSEPADEPAGVLRVPLPPEPVEPASPAEEAPVTTQVPPRSFARLAGLVARPGGDPASNARIALGEVRASCDGEGRFELALEAPPAGVDLVAFEPGFEPALRPSFGATLVPGGESRIHLVLGPPTLTLAGRVVDRDGNGVEGWTVELDELDPLSGLDLRQPAHSDADGRFLVPDVPAGVHVLRAFHEHPELAVRSLPADAGTEGILVTVNPSE